MAFLIAGLVLFLGIHTLTTLRPARQRLIGQLGEGAYKGLYSLLATVGLVLIVWGYGSYRGHGPIEVWTPPLFLHIVTKILMWLAFVALAATYAPSGRIKGTLHHPMLVAIKTWALAHLLVRGDLGSIVLFGSFLAWAVYDRIAVKRRGDRGAPPVAGVTLGDGVALGVGTLAYIAMYWLHPLLIGAAIS